MPSLNRPNAPHRLPSEDFKDLFFKPRVLRGSDARGSLNTPSPLSTPADPLLYRRALRSSEGGKAYSSSPLASPAIVTSQRRPQHPERSTYWSESSNRSATSRESSRDSPGASETIIEEFIPLEHISVSATSSDSNREWKSPDRRDAHVYPTALNSDQAPREARVGFKWTRDFLGGWLEIRVGRQRRSDGREANVEVQADEEPLADFEHMSPPSSTTSTVHLPLSHATTAGHSAGHASGQPLLSETPESFDSDGDSVALREGLYCRTKRALGLKHGPISPYIQTRTRTPTGAILDRVTSTLRFVPERAFSASTSAASSVSNLSIAAPRKRDRRPGHRSGWSASSSVRNLLMGGAPTGTPEPEAMYTGSDSKQYLSVVLTQPDAPAFLPSEARRVNTPPLPTEGSGKAYPRAFYFDFNTPDERDQGRFPRRNPPPSNPKASNDHGRQSGWYRAMPEAIDTRVSASQQDLDSNVPEHFPSSPLCPRNPKHASGGTGICPYHVKSQSSPLETEKRPSSTIGTVGTLSPVAENWWMS